MQMVRGRGRDRGRGRGRGRVPDERVEESHASQVGSEGVAGVSASMAGVPAGAAGLAAGDAHAGNDRIADLLTRFLERFPERIPAQAPVVPVVVEVQPQVAAAVAEELPSYLRMMEQMQRIGTGFFPGGANPEDADAWLRRIERNFLSSRCPAGYQVDIAVHYLEGDAHLWWRGVAARRVQAEMAWTDFVGEFNSKFFPQEAFNRLGSRLARLTQGDRSVREYEVEFNRLGSYVRRAVESESARVQRFLMGLRVDLRNRCMVRAFCTVDELVETAALLEEGLKDEVVVVTPSLQARSMPQQSGPSRGGKPMQGQKRKWDGSSSGSRDCQGCFGCGSMDHRVASCPKKAGVRVDSRVCILDLSVPSCGRLRPQWCSPLDRSQQRLECIPSLSPESRVPGRSQVFS